MVKVDKLINTLCPKGVEFRPLYSLTIWDKKFNGVDSKMQQKVITYKYYLSSEFEKVERPDGDVFYLSTGISGVDRYTTEELAGEYLSEGEVVCIPWGGTPNVKYYKGKFVTGDNRIATSADTNILNNKFLYYWMQSKLNIIETFYRGSGIKHPSMKSVLELNCPVPPLEVQCEIVHILDNFTLLSAELSAELKARQKQYKFYLEKLLDFKENVQRMKLIEVCEISRGIRVTKKNLQNGGSYPVYQNSLAPMGYYNKCNFKGGKTYIISAGAAGEIGFCENDFWAADDCLVIHNEKNIINKFVYYYLLMKQNYLYSNVRRASIPRLSRNIVEKIEIPVPSLEEQERIVNILDRFEKITNDISEGLPAEIEARRKQYEYYRDRLLTFKELKKEV